MDEIKDMNHKGAVSRFFSDKTIRTQAFGNNAAGERAYRRAERLAAAIHLVTNHISEDEPARRTIREASLELLSKNLELRDEMRAPDSSTMKDTQACIRKLISLSHVLAASGRVSFQNASVLASTLDELGVFLSASIRTRLSESTPLSHDELVDVGGMLFPSRLARRSLKGQTYNALKDKTQSSRPTASKVEKNHTRSTAILAVLKAQGVLGIKDIAMHLPEYSEKMIQRELKNLVAAETVKKSGSKRWSTYSLAQT